MVVAALVFVSFIVAVAVAGFRCSRCRCNFVAAIAVAGFCAAVAVPDHMTYESCDESGSCHVID